jgi:hypothetical protein
MTTRANIYVDQGIDFAARLELFSSNNQVYDITDEMFFCDIKKIYNKEIVFSANTSISTNGNVNVLQLIIDAEKTIDVEPGKYQYDVVMRRPSTGSNEKILEGLLIIIPTMTRVENVNV